MLQAILNSLECTFEYHVYFKITSAKGTCVVTKSKSFPLNAKGGKFHRFMAFEKGGKKDFFSTLSKML